VNSAAKWASASAEGAAGVAATADGMGRFLWLTLSKCQLALETTIGVNDNYA
jgi:CubicO group peptidase (beta-lactamase class C family)